MWEIGQALDEKVDKSDWQKKADYVQLQQFTEHYDEKFREMPVKYADKAKNSKDHKQYELNL